MSKNIYYTVVRRLNNNSIIAKNNSKDYVLIGKGIGFQKYPGDIVDEFEIDKKFHAMNDEYNRLNEIVEDIDESIFYVASNAVIEVENKFDIEVNPSIIFMLADHLEFAIQRVKESIKIQSPMKWQTSILYSKEYEYALFAYEYINSQLDLLLPSEEVDFITLHFVNASINNSGNMENTVKATRLIEEILNMTYEHFNLDPNKNSLSITRFITHLSFLIYGHLNGKKSFAESFDLSDVIQVRFPKEYSFAKEIIDYISAEENWKMYDDEILYLTIHLARILNN